MLQMLLGGADKIIKSKRERWKKEQEIDKNEAKKKSKERKKGY